MQNLNEILFRKRYKEGYLLQPKFQLHFLNFLLRKTKNNKKPKKYILDVFMLFSTSFSKN
jgi:hypothetical protein